MRIVAFLTAFLAALLSFAGCERTQNALPAPQPAPRSNVELRGKRPNVDVLAPNVDVNSDKDGVSVRAPRTDVQVEKKQP